LRENPQWRRRSRRMWVANIKMDLKTRGWGAMDEIGLVQNKYSGGLLWTRQWTFGFHKMLENSWVGAQLAASQEGMSSMESV
jgi:hypothetical protein